VNYAAARDYCVGLDSEQWDQLKKALPKNTKARVVEHHASCPHDQVGALLEQVRQSRSTDSVKWAFEFIVLTAASASGMPEPRSYAISLGANASAVLVAYGIAVDLHTKGVLYGLAVGKQKVILLRAADHPSSSELKAVSLFSALRRGRHLTTVPAAEKTFLSPLSMRAPVNRASASAIDFDHLLGGTRMRTLTAYTCSYIFQPCPHLKNRWSGSAAATRT
jgi:hypothetical protein